MLGLSALQFERTVSQHSGSGSIPSLSSTVTRGINETKSIREDFGRSMAQMKQIQARTAQEKNDHVQPVEVLVKEVEELRRELIEIKMGGRISQGKLETSMASIKGLTEKRISQMTAIMALRDRQVDERLKLMSETIHRGDLDVDERMVDFLTTDKIFNPSGKSCSGDGTKWSFNCASGTKN